jgi:hypothetical protein
MTDSEDHRIVDISELRPGPEQFNTFFFECTGGQESSPCGAQFEARYDVEKKVQLGEYADCPWCDGTAEIVAMVGPIHLSRYWEFLHQPPSKGFKAAREWLESYDDDDD